jgi:hypothetical protein
VNPKPPTQLDKPLSTDDRLELHELAARYGNVIDAREWDRLDTVFSADATFETHGFGDLSASHEGLAAITAMLVGGRHPVAHHVTNVEVRTDGDAVVLLFKVVGPGPRGRVGSVDYRDVVRKEIDGWRIVTHVATLRRADPPAGAGQSAAKEHEDR